METTNKKETIAVYSQKLAGALMLNGYQLLNTRKNRKYENKLVFIFRNSDELCAAIERYKTSVEDDTNGKYYKKEIKLQI